jgi:hypothetical protein
MSTLSFSPAVKVKTYIGEITITGDISTKFLSRPFVVSYYFLVELLIPIYPFFLIPYWHLSAILKEII